MDVIGDSYIVDASVVLAGLLLDEIYNNSADIILKYYQQKKIALVAPTLITYEVLNGVKSAVLRARVSHEIGEEVISRFQNLEISLIEPDEQDIFKTAISAGLSVYDSAYVSLIARKNSPLITADKKLLGKIKNKFKKTIWIGDFK